MSHLNQKNFIAAVKFIHNNIDQPIVLEDIAKAINLSVSSLKRLFLEATNQSAGTFIRRMRMERAFRSLQNQEDSVLEIALSAGFDDHSAFTRAFKNNFGYSPTFAREKLNIVEELEHISLDEPELVELNEIRLQSVTMQGSYFEAAPLAWQILKEHLSEIELDDDFPGVFIGMGHDNPHDGDVAYDKVRFSAGVSFAKTNLNIDETSIPKSYYAKFIFKGKLNNLGLAYHYIYGAFSKKSRIKINTSTVAFMVFDKFPDGLKELDFGQSYSVCLKKDQTFYSDFNSSFAHAYAC